jgi:hypothetical protein
MIDSLARTSAWRPRWLTLAVMLWLAFPWLSSADACNIPVFRYALERWQPDRSQLIVYYDARLSTSQRQIVDHLEARTIDQGGYANAEILRVPVGSLAAATEKSAQRDELIAAFDGPDDATLPQVVVRTKIGGRRWVSHWRGSLEELSTVDLLQSPTRRELSRRLLAGHSVVWLMLQSTDPQKNDATRERMETDLQKLAVAVELPEGVGLPGSELHSEVPLVVRFSLLEIDPNDPQEQFLARLFTGFYPDLVQQGEPLLIPVFGRGRALEVIPSADIDSPLTRDLTLFLAAACSCQVKEQNPGFDLLIDADWDSELFGTEGERPPPAKTVGDRSSAPLLLSIPPGRNN